MEVEGAGLVLCKVCSRSFRSQHGLRIHEGKTHRASVADTPAQQNESKE